MFDEQYASESADCEISWIVLVRVSSLLIKARALEGCPLQMTMAQYLRHVPYIR